MATLLDIDNITNSSETDKGTGVFDRLLASVELHIQEEFRAGRITGADYANVYLGAMQAALAQAVNFVLNEGQSHYQTELLSEQVKSEIKNNEVGGVIDLQKEKLEEEKDLVVAQTAAQYEGIGASQANTTRENLLNSKNVVKVEKESALLTTQNSELLSNGVVDRELTEAKTTATISGANNDTNRANAEVSLLNDQELEVVASTVRQDAESAAKVSLMADQETEVVAATARQDAESAAKISLMADQEAEVVAATTRENNESTAKISLMSDQEAEVVAATARQDAESVKKITLMEAQTVGFKTDAKQKLLKQMFDSYAVNVTTTGEVVGPPQSSVGSKLDSVANDILDDLGSSVNI